MFAPLIVVCTQTMRQCRLPENCGRIHLPADDPEQQIAALRIDPLPHLPGAQDVEAMNNRVTRLDLLYEATRRDQRESSMHALYTGLHQAMPQPAPPAAA